MSNDFKELVLVLPEIGEVVDVDPAVAEDLDGGFGELVGDEHFGGHHGLLSGYGKRMDRVWISYGRFRPRENSQAAADWAAISSAKAQSIHGISAATSAVSTVAPHQMRRPGGASR